MRLSSSSSCRDDEPMEVDESEVPEMETDDDNDMLDPEEEFKKSPYKYLAVELKCHLFSMCDRDFLPCERKRVKHIVVWILRHPETIIFGTSMQIAILTPVARLPRERGFIDYLRYTQQWNPVIREELFEENTQKLLRLGASGKLFRHVR